MRSEPGDRFFPMPKTSTLFDSRLFYKVNPQSVSRNLCVRHAIISRNTRRGLTHFSIGTVDGTANEG